MDEGLKARLDAYVERTGNEIDYDAAEKFYSEFDLDGLIERIASEWEIKVMSPEEGKEYDPEIEHYSYLLTRNGLNIFQPHNPNGEGLEPFGSEKDARADAERHRDQLAATEAKQQRDTEFLRTVNGVE